MIGEGGKSPEGEKNDLESNLKKMGLELGALPNQIIDRYTELYAVHRMNNTLNSPEWHQIHEAFMRLGQRYSEISEPNEAQRKMIEEIRRNEERALKDEEKHQNEVLKETNNREIDEDSK